MCTHCLACRGSEVEAKYSHLAPVGYDATPLGMLEYSWLDKNEGTSLIEEQLKAGRNVIADSLIDSRRAELSQILSKFWLPGGFALLVKVMELELRRNIAT